MAPDRVESVAEVRRWPKTGVGARLEVRDAGREMAAPVVMPVNVGEAGRETRTVVGVVAPLLLAIREPWPREPSDPVPSRLMGRLESRFLERDLRRDERDGRAEVNANARRRAGQLRTPATPVLARLREEGFDRRPADPLEALLLSSELPSELNPNSASMVGL